MKNIDKAPLPDREREAIERAVHTLKKHFPVERVILFGSKARGNYDTDSDIDLLVITTRELHWKEEKSVVHMLFDIGMEYDVIFSPLFATKEEWEGGIFTKFPIYQEILKDGAIVT